MNNYLSSKKSLLRCLGPLLLIMLNLGACTPIGKAYYAYKLRQGKDSLQKHYPQILVKMVANQEGYYQVVAPKSGALIKSGKFGVDSGTGDTLHFIVKPDYDYLEKRLYELGVKNARKARDGLRKHPSSKGARRVRRQTSNN